MNVIYAYRKKDTKQIVYVGQTTDIYSRHKRHINYDPYDITLKEYEYPLSRGIRKYGQDYYELIILEENVLSSKMDEREIYWINYYDTYWHGYNQTPGGKNPTFPHYNNDVIQLTISLLQDENLSFNDIKEKTGLSIPHIYNINIGTRRHQDNIKYPIRSSNQKGTKGLKFNPDEVKEIHEILLNSELSFKEIGKQFNCSADTISNINAGKTKKYQLKEYTYPLRKHPNSVYKKNYWKNKKACIDYPDKGSKTLISTEPEKVVV